MPQPCCRGRGCAPAPGGGSSCTRRGFPARPASGPIAVILEPAAPAEVAPLVLQAYGLTDREAQIAQLVLQGLTTSEIVERSPSPR